MLAKVMGLNHLRSVSYTMSDDECVFLEKEDGNSNSNALHPLMIGLLTDLGAFYIVLDSC